MYSSVGGERNENISAAAVSLFKTIAGVTAALVFSLGLLVLAVWLFNIRDLEIYRFNPIAMKPNAAFMFVLTGASLWFLRASTRRMRLVSNSCASLTVSTGLLTLFEDLFNLDLGIDNLLFVDIPNLLMTAHPGRIAPVTAVNFVMAGVALLLINVETKRGLRPSQFISIVFGSISVVTFMGDFYGITMTYMASTFAVMASHTSFAFILTSLGILFIRPDKGIMTFLVQDGLGSTTARRILAAVALAPLLADAVLITGHRAGLYDMSHTMAFHTLIVTFVIVITVLRSSLALNKIDWKQRKSEADRESVARFPGENPSPVIRITRGLSVTYANSSSEPLIDFIGFHKDGDNLHAGPMWSDLVTEALTTGQLKTVEIPVDDRIYQFTISPMPDKDYANLYGADITRLKSMEKALDYERGKLQNILNSIQDGIYIVNRQYTIEYANPVVIKEFGTCEQMTCYSYFHGLSEVCPWCRNEEVYDGRTVQWEFTLSRTGKTYDIIDTPLINQDGSISKLEIFRDITERKKMENDLRLFSRAIDDALDGVHIVDMSGKIIYANEAALKQTGYSIEETVGMEVFDLAADRDFGENNIHPAILRDGSWSGELLSKKKDGTLYTGWLTINMIKDADGKPLALIGMMRDITTKKRIEDALRVSEANMRATMNAITESLCLIDTNGVFITVNDMFARRFDRKSEEIVGTNMTDLLPPEILETRRKHFYDVISTGNPVSFEDVRAGRHFFSNMYPVFDDGDKISGVAVYANDITTRKKYEEYLLNSIKEKEMLMREIHHRVKNNLQIIAGLIGLQLNHVTDETQREMLIETMSRIKSIALVHDKLYGSKGIAEVDLKKYIVSLSNDLFHSFGIDKKRVALNLAVENIVIGVDIAVPCGLIINELFTNILKYAFPDKKIGEIVISIDNKKDGNIEMVIADNGVGFPEDVDFRKTKSLGLHIVNLLVKQIGGAIELDRTSGSRFTITFSKQ